MLCLALLLLSVPAAYAADNGAETEITELPLKNIILSSAEDREEKGKDIVNILLLGTDEKLAYTHDVGRSDCTMLVSLNCETGTVKLISFERGPIF